MIFVVANREKDKPVLINPAKISHITTKVGISGTPWSDTIKTEIRYDGGCHVAYSPRLPHELMTVDLFTKPNT